jgi:hypothetical protein
VFQEPAGGDAVLHPVGLGPGPAHGHAPAGVEDAEVDAIGVGEPAHSPAQGVQLPHHVPLAHAADAGVAAHLADLIQVHGEQGGGHTHAGGNVRRLDAGVPASDHHNPHASCR